MNRRYTNWERIPAILTVDEVSILLDMANATVRRLIINGEIPATKVGKSYRFSKEEIKKYMEGTATPNPTRTDLAEIVLAEIAGLNDSIKALSEKLDRLTLDVLNEKHSQRNG